MKQLMFFSLAVVACMTVIASADVAGWQSQAQGTAGNVVADGSGWTFDGTAGVSFDYGALDAYSDKPVDGATIEYIFNISDAGASITLGSSFSWSPGSEISVYKLEQWDNTGKFGITAPGFWDKTLATDSIFNEDVHVAFVRNNDSGTIDLYVNGVFAETESSKTNWRMDGGVGTLGSTNSNSDVPTGTIYGVGSYDRALEASEIEALYSVFSGWVAFGQDPENGKIDVMTTKSLSWNAPTAFAVSGYEIYLDPNETFVTNGDLNVMVTDDADLTDTLYDPTIDLEYETTYYWRVDSIEPNETSFQIHEGMVWSFTTAPEDPQVDVDPKNTTADAVGIAVFTVVGINQVGYEWYKYVDGINDALVGTEAVLTLENITIDDEGLYYCVLIGKVGTNPDVSGMAQLWARREMAHWGFEDTLTDSVDGWVGVYSDPNVDNLPPDPTSDYYYIDEDNAISGKALDLRNSDYFVTVDGSDEFFNFHPHGFTANTWMKLDEDGAWELAVAKVMIDRYAAWGIGRYSDAGFMAIRGTGLYPDVFGGKITFGENTWHMVTTQFDPASKTYKMYVDGVLVSQTGEVTQEILVGSEPLTIGAETYTGRALFNGIVDEVQIWSYALEPVDVALLYTTLSGNVVCLDSEGLQYDFNGDCIVDVADFAEFAASWMNCRQVPTCLP